MSLVETIKELKSQIEDEENKESEESEGKTEDKIEENLAVEEVKGETVEEKPKAEEKAEEEPDNNAYRRMRREATAAKKLAEEKERENAELRAKLAAPKEENEETEIVSAAIDPEIEEIKRERMLTKAERAFQSLEAKFRDSNPEYDAIAGEYCLALAQSIKIQNPRLSNNEIAEKTKESILYKAANFMKEGFDPIEELFHEAKELGFTGKKKEEQKSEEVIKPDMKKVAANRTKSTGMTASNGKSEGLMTKEYAGNNLTIAEWKKLPSSEKRRIMYG